MSTHMETLTAAVSWLTEVRNYPVHPKVEKSMLRWARKSREDARAAIAIMHLTSEPAIDAVTALLNRAITAYPVIPEGLATFSQTHLELWEQDNKETLALAAAIVERHA